MTQPFQSSFIPKESTSQNSFGKKSMGLMGFVGTLFIVGSIVASLGLFVYIRIVKSEVKSLKDEVVLAEQNIDNATIQEMSRFNERLTSVKGIVSRHQVVSNFLNLLSSITVNDVEYIEFQYLITQNGSVVVILDGTAKNYASIALQENIFSSNQYIKSVKFGDLSLSENNRVSFRLTIEAVPEISIYNPPVLGEDNVGVSEGGEDVSTAIEGLEDLEIPDLNI